MSALPNTEAYTHTLWQIDAAMNQIAEAFDLMSDNGASEESLQTVEDFFADLLNDRDKKLDAYAALIRQYEFKAKNRKAESDRIAALAKQDENAAKRLKDRLKFYFDANGITKLETPMNKFNIQANGGSVSLLVDEDRVPDDYTVTNVVPDRERIREALEAGKELDFARFGERGTQLRIK